MKKIATVALFGALALIGSVGSASANCYGSRCGGHMGWGHGGHHGGHHGTPVDEPSSLLLLLPAVAVVAYAARKKIA